ncbi:uncharacterized protein TNCV_952891 [Trichonephila clavipes]|nr:uncharacterized protein TNCV_952891 [Trichonephila clavipes]
MQKTGFHLLKDDEIVTSVQEEFASVHDETNENENNNESSKGPSNADAFSALEWYEQQTECCFTQLLQLKRFRHLSAKTRRCTMVQR